jgi:uracil phosphoribosyltransferase
MMRAQLGGQFRYADPAHPAYVTELRANINDPLFYLCRRPYGSSLTPAPGHGSGAGYGLITNKFVFRCRRATAPSVETSSGGSAIADSFVDQYLTIIEHALAVHKLTLMRDRSRELGADIERFRRLMREVGLILCSEATRDLSLEPYQIEVSDGKYEGLLLEQTKLVVIPILRAGLVLAEAFFELVPMARSGHIGLFRGFHPDEITNYLTSIPSAPVTDFFVLDPVIATSKTICTAVDILLGLDVEPKRIRILSVIAARQGIEAFYSNPEHARIRLFTVAVDPELDEHGFVVPGIGDAGDRLFGTEKDFQW